jgi:hypothetical protein
LPFWRGPLALLALAVGYAAAFSILGGSSPNHEKLLQEAVKSQLVVLAQGIAGI